MRRSRWRTAIVAAAVGVATIAGGPATAVPTPPPTPALPGEPPADWPALPSGVEAPVVLLVEGETGQVLASERADRRRAVASTIKLLTALTVVHRAELDEEVTIDAAAAATGGSSVELEAGDRWTVEQLLLGLLVRSGNDAAEALATHVGGDRTGFLELMTADAAALGLPVGPEGIVLTSPTGLDDGNRLSAEDLAVLARAALADPVLRPMLAVEEVTLPGLGEVENRNELLDAGPGVTGVKTGFTEAAGNSLIGSAERDGRELVVVVLGGGPDPERFVDAATVLDHGFEAFRPETLDVDLTLLVAGGTTTVTVPSTDITVPVDATARFDLPVPRRTPESDELEAALEVEGDTLTVVPATVTRDRRSDGPEEMVDDGSGGIAVGRAVVDGVHAALRAAHARGAFGPASAGVSSR